MNPIRTATAATVFSRLGSAREKLLVKFGGLGGTIVLVLVVFACASIFGLFSVANPGFAILGAVVVLAIAIAFVDPLLLVAMVLPASLLMARVGVLSIADFVLAGGAAVALIVMRGYNKESIRPLMWAGTAYLALALPTTVLNPYSANIIEWVHELVLVFGSMVVGYALGRRGRAGFAVGAYIWCCIILAAAAFINGLVMLATVGSFGPVYFNELSFHKNFIGGVIAIAIVMLYSRPVWLSFPPRLIWAAIFVLVLGLAASGARQGMIAVVAGVLIVSLRPRPETGRYPKIVWIAAIPVVIGILVVVNDQLESGDQYNSAYERLNWYDESLRIWSTSPIFGVGLRWWYTDRFPLTFQPPNAELEVISSVGVVGLVGFLLMFILGFIALWRLNPVYGTVGAAIIVTRFAQAQFDLYWVAGQASVLWIVAAICFGANDRDRANGEEKCFDPSVRKTKESWYRRPAHAH